MDHEEMRNAYLRALVKETVDFKLYQCNICGVENNNFGDYILLETASNFIKMWNCQECLDEEEKEALV